MKPKDYAIYHIRVDNINPVDQRRAVIPKLEELGVPRSYQRCPSDMEIGIPRLPTFWRGDEEEQDWQHEVKRALSDFKPPLDIEFEAAPWSSPPDYPRGDPSL